MFDIDEIFKDGNFIYGELAARTFSGEIIDIELTDLNLKPDSVSSFKDLAEKYENDLKKDNNG